MYAYGGPATIICSQYCLCVAPRATVVRAVVDYFYVTDQSKRTNLVNYDRDFGTKFGRFETKLFVPGVQFSFADRVK